MVGIGARLVDPEKPVDQILVARHCGARLPRKRNQSEVRIQGNLAHPRQTSGLKSSQPLVDTRAEMCSTGAAEPGASPVCGTAGSARRVSRSAT